MGATRMAIAPKSRTQVPILFRPRDTAPVNAFLIVNEESSTKTWVVRLEASVGVPKIVFRPSDVVASGVRFDVCQLDTVASRSFTITNQVRAGGRDT